MSFRKPAALAALPREVTVLAAVAFAVAVGFGIVAPALPLFARSFHVSRQAAGAVISIFAFMRLISAFGGGRLVNRFGERRILAYGISIVAISSLLAGLAQSYVQLLLLRGAGGIGSAMFTVSASGLLFRVVPAEQRGQANGVFIGGFILGGITGPAFGGLITGVSPRAPFFMYAATLGVAAFIGVRNLPNPPDAQGAEKSTVPVMALLDALKQRPYIAAMATQFADSWAVIGVRTTLVPLFIHDALHRKPIWTGVGFVLVAAINAAVLLPAGKMADTRGRKPLLVGGLLFCCAGLTVLATSTNLPAFLSAMAVIGFGSGLLDVAPSAVVGDVLAGKRAGTVVASFQMAGDAGAVIGPIVAGRLADRLGFGAAFGVAAGVLLAAALVALTAPETRRPGGPSAGVTDPTIEEATEGHTPAGGPIPESG